MMVLAKPSEAVGKVLRLTRGTRSYHFSSTQDGIKVLHDAMIAGRKK